MSERARDDSRIKFIRNFHIHEIGDVVDLGYGRGEALVARRIAEWAGTAPQKAEEATVVVKRGRGRPQKVVA